MSFSFNFSFHPKSTVVALHILGRPQEWYAEITRITGIYGMPSNKLLHNYANDMMYDAGAVTGN